MILFVLKCVAGHEFDAWFRDNAAYDRQHRRGFVSCPDCGSRKVEKAPMAPRLGRSRGDAVTPASTPIPGAEEASEAVTAASTEGQVSDAPPSPAQLRRALQILRRHVEQTCDYVGPTFAKEARRIHNGEVEARGIYGEATSDERQALLDDGIEVTGIPWVPSSDA